MNCEINIKSLIPSNWTKTSRISTKIDGNILIAKTPLDGRFSSCLSGDQLFYPDNLFNYAKKHFKVSFYFTKVQVYFEISNRTSDKMMQFYSKKNHTKFQKYWLHKSRIFIIHASRAPFRSLSTQKKFEQKT